MLIQAQIGFAALFCSRIGAVYVREGHLSPPPVPKGGQLCSPVPPATENLKSYCLWEEGLLIALVLPAKRFSSVTVILVCQEHRGHISAVLQQPAMQCTHAAFGTQARAAGLCSSALCTVSHCLMYTGS